MKILRRMAKITATVLASVMLLGVFAGAAAPADGGEEFGNEGVKGYVVRLYSTVLGREPDPKGLREWYDGLVEGRFEAAEAAVGFFESPEYIAKDKNDDEYLLDLYHTFFDREPDAEGLEGWSARLEAGMSRRNVLKGFVDSNEFSALCSEFGVTKGTVEAQGADESYYLVQGFVERLYREALGRDADQGGRDSWKKVLLDKTSTGADVAYGFIFSDECRALTTDNTVYVKTLYRTLLGREADDAGLAGWVSNLENGQEREEIFEGFVNSAEFTSICDSYGIVRGDYKFRKGRDIDPTKPMIALTFDDGPSTRTHEIVECLEANGAVATFFVQGCQAKYFMDVLTKEDEIGCEIGNHTYNHPYITSLSADGLRAQLGDTDAIINEATGHNSTVMRPPYGSHNAFTDSIIGVPIIIWSVDTRDWATRNTQSTINHVLANAKDGDIILMHDIHTSTVDAALYLIPELQNRGFQLVTVSELAEYRGGANPGSTYYSFRP